MPVASRRGVLRRASVVAAGVGAAGVASAIAARPAQAAINDPLTAGNVVDAQGNTTGVTNDSATNPTFALTNPNGATLQLVPRGQRIPQTAPVGSIQVGDWGEVEVQLAPNTSFEFYTNITGAERSVSFLASVFARRHPPVSNARPSGVS